MSSTGNLSPRPPLGLDLVDGKNLKIPLRRFFFAHKKENAVTLYWQVMDESLKSAYSRKDLYYIENTYMKAQQYQSLTAMLMPIMQDENDMIAKMSTLCCELKTHFEHFHWVGFYRNVGMQMLKVGPYQGGHGCLSIPFEKGVCGKCATERKTQIVANVNALPYHIACSSSTQSEIVVPIIKDGELIAVLDIDSNDTDQFDEIDQHYLEALVALL